MKGTGLLEGTPGGARVLLLCHPLGLASLPHQTKQGFSSSHQVRTLFSVVGDACVSSRGAVASTPALLLVPES